MENWRVFFFFFWSQFHVRFESIPSATTFKGWEIRLILHSLSAPGKRSSLFLLSVRCMIDDLLYTSFYFNNECQKWFHMRLSYSVHFSAPEQSSVIILSILAVIHNVFVFFLFIHDCQIQFPIYFHDLIIHIPYIFLLSSNVVVFVQLRTLSFFLFLIPDYQIQSWSPYTAECFFLVQLSFHFAEMIFLRVYSDLFFKIQVYMGASPKL